MSSKDQQRVRSPKSESDVEFAHGLSVDFFLDQDILTGWEIEGADGKPVPFSRENLRSFFISPDYRWTFREVDAFFTDESNFTEATTEQVLGE